MTTAGRRTSEGALIGGNAALTAPSPWLKRQIFYLGGGLVYLSAFGIGSLAMFVFQQYRAGCALAVVAAIAGAHCIGIGEWRAGHRFAIAMVTERLDASALAAATISDIAINTPPATGREGYLYVIKFSTGVVKPGQSRDPRRRLAEHRRDAWVYKVTIVDYWISAPHANYLSNEIDLIEQCRAASERAKWEYFHDVDFASVRDIAASMSRRANEATA